MPGRSSLGLLIFSLLAGAGCQPPASAPAPPPSSATASTPAPAPAELTLRLPDSAAVTAPLALDDRSRQLGLMHVDHLPADRGMLFVFPEPQPERFWMKNCLIPLDMVFMDEKGKVVFVADHVPICTADPCPNYGPAESVMVQLVLELGAGEAARHGLRPGVTLELPELEKLKAEAR
jgi:uncharacterized membrane protein (UPF0127 family)